MKILSAKVSNYRVHEDVEVTFDEQISVLGGANEAGKSTLIEAIHRALFVPAKGNTEVHRNMARSGTNEKPQVSIEFEHGGNRWVLEKVFGGNNAYSVQLRQEGHPATKDNVAEDQLRELIGAGIPGGKRLKEDIARKPWSHLWVWQGASGSAPKDFIEDTTDQLVNLTNQGAGAVLMSDFDSGLAKKFEEEYNAIYTSTKKVKAKSPLDVAESEHAACLEQIGELKERVKQLEGAAKNYASAKHRRRTLEPELSKAREGLVTLDKQLTDAEDTRRELDRDQQHAKQLLAEVTRLRAQAQQLKKWNSNIDELTKQLSTDDQTHELAEHVEKTTTQFKSSRKELATQRAELKSIGDRQAHAEAYVNLFRAQQDVEVAKKNSERLAGLRQRLDVTKEKLRGLPDITDAAVTKLRERKQQLAIEAAKLQAAASTLKVSKSDSSLTVNDHLLQAGQSIELDQDTVLRFGTALEIELTVPGSKGWAAKKDDLASRQLELKAEVASFQIAGAPAEDINALATSVLTRKTLLSEAEQVNKDIQAEAPAAIEKASNEAAQAVRLAQARIDQVEHPEQFAVPASLGAATTLAQTTTDEYRAFEAEVTKADKAVSDLQHQLEQQQQRQAAFAKTRRATEDSLKEAEALRKNLLAGYDDHETAFQKALNSLESEHDAAERRLKRTQEAFAALQLDAVELRKSRISQQVERFTQELKQVDEQQNQALGQLNTQGNNDPFTELRDAQQRLERLAANCERQRLEADATALLHEAFKAELNAANERITKPLAEKVGAYLWHLDNTAEIRVNYGGSNFQEFQLYRPDLNPEPEPFSTLSGGAREQVAAAVRLATAQILAEDYGGTLPVVFDDAFVNSDPERTKKVVNMLFYAKEQGLQVIIATCDPHRYEGVGKAEYKLVRGAGAKSIAKSAAPKILYP